jgi:hypothetical protein
MGWVITATGVTPEIVLASFLMVYSFPVKTVYQISVYNNNAESSLLLTSDVLRKAYSVFRLVFGW